MGGVPRPGALREDEGVLTPPALRMGRRGKGREAGPEKSGSHRKRSLDEVSGSFQPRGAGQELSGSRQPCSQGILSGSGVGAHRALRHPHTCQREAHPSLPAPLVFAKREPNPRAKPQSSATSAPLPPPSSSPGHPRTPPPASRACSPGGSWGCKAGTAKRCKSQNSLWSHSRHSRHRQTAVLGSQPGGAGFQAKGGREKPVLNRKRNCKGRRGGRMPSAGRMPGLRTSDPSVFQRFEARPGLWLNPPRHGCGTSWPRCGVCAPGA